ncbi:MAG TPA: metallophosphoesterase family protein [Chloroflexota bacterium]|nr:metallophosphoesterase family protein [Chloroflexota bacterium]
MRVGVVSDVHNNAEALSYALDSLRGCELILSLGDLVSQYRATPEILSLARDAQLTGIVGNHEKTILAPCGTPVRSRLAADDLNYLVALPHGREMEIDGRKLSISHGAPWDDPDDMGCEYVFESDTAKMKRLAATPADIVLIGHTHFGMLLRAGGKLLLNPGSCGEARDAARRLSFAELDFAAGKATVYEIRHGSPPEPMLIEEF